MRKLRLEKLEERTLLAGLTVIVHGASPVLTIPDWVTEMGRAVRDRANYDCSDAEVARSVISNRSPVIPAASCDSLLLFEEHRYYSSC